MYVNCTVKGERGKDAAERRLRVLKQLKEYNDPQLWGNVSPLILDDGKLDLTGVITGSSRPQTEEQGTKLLHFYREPNSAPLTVWSL
jgi:hypothetical protein